MAEEREEKKSYTISDIARELGVNKATVSKAISGKGSLRPETRSRILDFIDRCGYRPNAVAQSLARSRTYNIGLMMPGDAGVFEMAFFRDCLQGVCRMAADNGYDILLTTMDRQHPVEQMARLIGHRKIDGVIAMRSLVRSPVLGFLKEEGLPFVLIGPASDPTVLSVDNDNRSACRDLTALLIQRGVRRMALLGGDENYCVTHTRLAGFQDACAQAGLPPEEQFICLNTNRAGRLAEAMDTVLGRGADCIVCMDDYICSLALDRVRSSRLRIPQDVKLASFYDNPVLENITPSVTSLRFDAARLGRAACGRLIDVLEGREGGSLTLPGYQVILRDSTN